MANHLDAGRTPAPVSVYLRDLSGWCDTEVTLEQGKRYEARQGDFDTVLRHNTTRGHEYFLVENRTQAGFDRFLPARGLAVYHCDTRGSNEVQQGRATRDVPERTVSAESVPGPRTADGSSAPVSDVVHLDSAGPVRALPLSADLTQGSVGDLAVELTLPMGRRAVVHHRSGGVTKDLHLQLDPNPLSALEVLVGQPVSGNWRLSVLDTALSVDAPTPADVTVQRRRLEVTPGP